MRATRLLGTLLIVVLFAGAGAARAEFQLTGSGASVPPPDPAPSPSEPQNPPGRRLAKARSDPGLAQGFGHQVPLGFAVRQIVPARVQVSFGGGIDPEDQLVDWKGGKPWPDVLRSTLRPSGLLVTFRPGTVLIKRASPS